MQAGTMTSVVTLVHVLTCLIAVHLISVQGQSTCCPTENCCVDSCDAPTPLNITLDEFVSSHPHYVTILPAIPLFAGVDNICYTSVYLPDGSYLLNGVTVYSNGFNITQECLVTQVDVGVFSMGTSTAIGQLVVFDYLQTCDLFLAYICFLYGDGSYEPGNKIPVVALSPNPGPISQDCLASAMVTISNDGVDSQCYFILPYDLPTGCVTDIPCTTDASE